LNEIILLVDKFKNYELLFGIIDYLISQEHSKADIEALFSIDKQVFENICKATIDQRLIPKDKYRQLFKLLCKKMDLKRLCELVLAVCKNEKLLYVIEKEE